MKTTAVADHITGWMKNYVIDAGQSGFVVGISGGIDSAVTSTLAARTGFPVLCLDLPIHQDYRQLNRAAKHMEQLKQKYQNVNLCSIDLSSTFDQFLVSLPNVKRDEAHDLAGGNSRARLRMTTLYYFATINKYLVAGTGNKVEDFGIGFFTKYGDGGVDLSPIADLTKTQVYELAREFGIDESILNAPPTDGLWGDDRTDEDQIGATYSELEWAMKTVEEGKSEDDLSGREKEVMQIFMRYNRANEHKMLPIPICKIPDYLL